MPSQGTIGDRVRGLRLSRRMSQAQLAGPDLSDSYVSLIESGKRTPTPAVARLLAERLGCTTEFLLHGIEPRQRIDTELSLRHAELELHHGSPAVAADRFKAIMQASDGDNATLATRAHVGFARALEAQGKIEQAVEEYERLRREAMEHPERLSDLPLIVALCRCYQRAGDRLRARDLGAEAQAKAERIGIVSGEVAIDLALALVETGTGLPYVERVLDLTGVPEVRDRTAEVQALWRASTTAAEGDDSALAVQLAEDALAVGRPARTALTSARIARELAQIRVMDPNFDDLERAKELAEVALRVFTGLSADPRELGRSLAVLGWLRIRTGDTASAIELAQRMLELSPATGGIIAATAHLVLAKAALARSDDATLALRRAHELLDGDPEAHEREAAKTWRMLGDLYGQAGDRRSQATAYRKALEAVGIHVTIPGVAGAAMLAG